MVALERTKWNLDKAKEFFKDNGCVLLEEIYINARIPMKYICKCGNQSKIRLDDFRKGKRCLECKNKLMSEKFKKDTNKIIKTFRNFNYEVIEEVEKKNHRRFKVKCPKGHETIMYNQVFERGGRCRVCNNEEKSKKLRKPLEDVKNEFKEGGCELLSSYVNMDTPVSYKCSCGNISKITLGAFRNGIRCGCQVPRGKAHPLYNHDMTDDERFNRRKEPQVKEWRLKVFERDRFTCQKCYEKGGKLEAHHIENWSTSKELRYEVKNGITLCKWCHRLGENSFHRIYGVRNNTEAQLKEFLKL